MTTFERPIGFWLSADFSSIFIERLRSACVISIISLHVILSNRHQFGAQQIADNAYNLAIVVGSIFSNEALIFISFVLAFPLLISERFSGFLISRSIRIGTPFLLFTSLYVLIDSVGQRQGVFFRFAPAEAVVLLLVAGLGEYHLHFLPALLILILISPIFCWNLQLCVIIPLVCVGSVARFLIEYLTISSSTTITASQLLWLHGGKLIAYAPFGFLACWFIHQWPFVIPHRSRRVLLVELFLILIGLIVIDLWLMSGPNLDLDGRLRLRVAFQEIIGSLLVVLGIFLVATYTFGLVVNTSKEPVYSMLYSRTFLLFMIHPVFLMIYRSLAGSNSTTIFGDLLCFGFVLSSSWVTAGVLKQIVGRTRTILPQFLQERAKRPQDSTPISDDR
jgi:hypothetical protein